MAEEFHYPYGYDPEDPYRDEALMLSIGDGNITMEGALAHFRGLLIEAINEADSNGIIVPEEARSLVVSLPSREAIRARNEALENTKKEAAERMRNIIPIVGRKRRGRPRKIPRF